MLQVQWSQSSGDSVSLCRQDSVRSMSQSSLHPLKMPSPPKKKQPCRDTTTTSSQGVPLSRCDSLGDLKVPGALFPAGVGSRDPLNRSLCPLHAVASASLQVLYTAQTYLERQNSVSDFKYKRHFEWGRFLGEGSFGQVSEARPAC